MTTKKTTRKKAAKSTKLKKKVIVLVIDTALTNDAIESGDIDLAIWTKDCQMIQNVARSVRVLDVDA